MPGTASAAIDTARSDERPHDGLDGAGAGHPLVSSVIPCLDEADAISSWLASEQVICRAQLGLTIRELPIEYRPGIACSKLSPVADALSHRRVRLAAAAATPRSPQPRSER